jgi:hypothetical protein
MKDNGRMILFTARVFYTTKNLLRFTEIMISHLFRNAKTMNAGFTMTAGLRMTKSLALGS